MKGLLDVCAGDRGGASPLDLGQPTLMIAPTALASDPTIKPARPVAGRYQLRSLLGRGGMGLVWLARTSCCADP